MRSIRKLVLLGVAALMVCAAVAASASATTITQGGVAYSGSVTGTNSGNAVLSGAFGATITCTASTIGGTTNSSGSGSITSVSFTGCSNSFGSCTVSSTASTSASWASTAVFDSLHTGGRDGTLTAQMGTGTVTTVCPGPFGTTLTCVWQGTGTNHGVTGNVFNSDHTARYNASLSSGCGNGTWNATYVLTGSGGGALSIAA